MPLPRSIAVPGRLPKMATHCFLHRAGCLSRKTLAADLEQESIAHGKPPRKIEIGSHQMIQGLKRRGRIPSGLFKGTPILRRSKVFKPRKLNVALSVSGWHT